MCLKYDFIKPKYNIYNIFEQYKTFNAYNNLGFILS